MKLGLLGFGFRLVWCRWREEFARFGGGHLLVERKEIFQTVFIADERLGSVTLLYSLIQRTVGR